MKKFKQLIAVALTFTMLISSSPFIANAEQTDNDFSNYGTGDLSLVTENPDNPTVISSVSDYLEVTANTQNNKKDISVTGASSLPYSVDNSTSPYFPEIESQGTLGSCVPFACVYYQFSYEMNRSRGVTTTKDNTFSVKWAYNIVNRGSNTGTNYAVVYGLLKQHGAPTSKSVPYDAKDYLSWSTDEKVWREAMRYRLKDYQLFEAIGSEGLEITSSDDPDLLPIKTALNNGDVLTFSTYITSIEKGKKKLKTNPDAPENDKFANEQYLRCLPATEGGHRMTIVGYNDNLWCDINDNNKIDDGEMGAFKVANSWGKNYSNKGFLWFSYDSLNNISCVEGVEENSKRFRAMTEITRIDVREANEGSDIYAKLTVNSANRSKFSVAFTGSMHGSEFERYLLEEAKLFSTSNNYAFDGTTTACDATFLYPLDDLNPALTPDNFEDQDFSITVRDTASDSSTVIVKNVSLVNEYTGKEYKVNANYPITLNASDWSSPLKEKTRNSVVVYYAGFDEPNLHYRKSGSSFTKVKMQANDERHGYLYKYVLERTNSNVDIYFSDDSGKVDNNSGSYYTANVGLNYYFTEGQREEIKISDLKLTGTTPDVGKRCYIDFNTTGGYEPYQYKYTLEDLNTGATKTINYNVPYKNNPFKYEKETTYKLTVEAMDYAKQTTSSSILIEVTDHPFAIASLTADKENGLVSKELAFTSITEFEGLMSGPHTPKTRFVIKDSGGKVWCDNEVKYTKSNYTINSTTTVHSFTPQVAGEYTLTVSSTDWNKEYAEKTINFKVYDMIYGDADGNGAVNILDATITQKHLANLLSDADVYLDLADCDTNTGITIMDATTIQLYLAHSENSGKAGNVVEYTPIEPTEPPTEAPTQKPTTGTSGNKVTFTNSLNWSGTIYCYYWSDSNTSMTSWPGKAMKSAGTNEFSQTLYTFDVPSGVKYIIFTNGSEQTVDITYPGGEVKYYALNTKTGNGYNVETWQ